MITTSAAAASPMEFVFVAFDPLDATGLGLSTLDAAVTSRLAPTVAGRTLDVSATGEAGLDWANIGAPTTAQNLSATNIDVDQVVASVSGAVGSVTAGVTLAASAVQAIWDALTSALTTVGSIGKLLVDNVNATISSRSSHSAADVWAVATRLLTAGTNIALAKGVGVTGFNDLSAADVRTAVGLASANLDTQLDALPTAAENADAVWDEMLAGHLGVGSTGEALNGAGAAGDPWTTALPGAYGAGSAGNIIGNNVNATISSRATQTSVDTVDTVVDAILADTGTDGVAVAAASKTGYALTSGERDSIADAYLDRAGAIEIGLTPRQAMRLFGAALAGKLSGAATVTVTIRNAVADDKNRIIATVDGDGNRSLIVYDLT
jgi:hypothetical protein